MRTEAQEIARRIQVETYELLKREPFAALVSRPPSEEVPLPAQARGATVVVRKRETGTGQVEIEVELRQRFWLFFHGVLRKTFQMKADGTVIDDNPRTYRSESDHSFQQAEDASLPPDIQQQIVEYVRREFGEHEGMPDALRAHDLRYVGVSRHGGKVSHYWSIPSTTANRWAVVTIREERLEFDITTKPPKLSA